MGEKMDEFRNGLDVEAARNAVPEMSSYEEPYYRSGPTFLSMFPRYFLILIVFGIHVMFWSMNDGDLFDRSEDSGGLGLVMWLLDIVAETGIVGFFFLMIGLTWINRFVNFSTSGGLYTVSLLVISITPGLFFFEEMFTSGIIGGILGTDEMGFLPDWNNMLYLIFGGAYAGVMFLLTVMYQRAFTYVITDKQVYLKKEFLKFIDANSHAISLTKIENLKVERGLIGRMLGYGSLHVITASGMGLRQESMSVGIGTAAEVSDAATKTSSNFLVRMIRFMFVVIRLQRTRTTVDLDPEDCFYGIRNPMDVYALVNELRTRPGAPVDGATTESSDAETTPDSSEIEVVE